MSDGALHFKDSSMGAVAGVTDVNSGVCVCI